jgi:tetratricopeptide (TPR) repeat protein
MLSGAWKRLALLLLATPLAAQVGAAALHQAEELIEAGHWKRARTMVEGRLQESPDDALATFLLSQIRFAFGDHESPMKLAERAVALDPGVARFHRQVAEVAGMMAQRANLFQQIGLARRFKTEIDAAISLDPKDIQALRDLMEYYLLAPGIAGGDKAKARAVAEQIGRVDRGEGFAAEARLAAFAKDARKQESLLRQAAEASPSHYKLRIALAEFYLKQRGNLDAAIEAAREAVHLDPARADGYSILAEAYGARGQLAEMDAVLAAADQAVPDDRTPHYRAAEGLLRYGKFRAEAERQLRVYLAQEPEGNEPTLAQARERVAQAIALGGLRGFGSACAHHGKRWSAPRAQSVAARPAARLVARLPRVSPPCAADRCNG